MIGHNARLWRRWMALLLLPLALGNSGCLLLAGGAAGAAGYAYYKGQATETLNADFASVFHATKGALNDLGMPVTVMAEDSYSGTIESETGTMKRVKIRLEQPPPNLPADQTETKVGIRVATFGDDGVSKRIMDGIKHRLATQGPVPASPALSRAPAATAAF